MAHSGKCPMCTNHRLLTEYYEKLLGGKKIMICDDCQVLMNRYVDFLEKNHGFEYKMNGIFWGQ